MKTHGFGRRGWLAATTVILFGAGCGSIMNGVALVSGDAPKDPATHVVEIDTVPPGADIYLVNLKSNHVADPLTAHLDATYLGTAPARAETRLDVASWWNDGAYLGLWLLGTVIDAGVTGYLGIRYADSNSKNDKTALLVSGGVVAADLLGFLLLGINSPVPEQATYMAQLPGHANQLAAVTVPDTSELTLTLRPGQPAYGASALKRLTVKAKPLGKVVVMNLKAVGLDEVMLKSAIDTSINEMQRYSMDDVLGVKELESMLEFEKLKDTLGCDDASCFAELGGAIGASLVLTGDVSKDAGTVTVNLRLTDTKSVRVIGRVRYQRPYSKHAGSDAVTEAVWQLMRQVEESGRL